MAGKGVSGIISQTRRASVNRRCDKQFLIGCTLGWQLTDEARDAKQRHLLGALYSTNIQVAHHLCFLMNSSKP